MWYRITLWVTGRKVMSGIRKIDDKNLYRIELMVAQSVDEVLGLHRLKAMDLTRLPEDHPEVLAILRSGKEIPELK